jgi:hypothetical protein
VFAEQQIAQIRVQAADGEYRGGTGYLLTPTLVLTSGHVWRGREGPQLPRYTVSLRELKCWVGETLLRALPERDDEATRRERARRLHNLGNWYDDVGRREDALAVRREAVRLYRPLAAQLPAVFAEDLDDSEQRLAQCLRALGRDPATDPDLA